MFTFNSHLVFPSYPTDLLICLRYPLTSIQHLFRFPFHVLLYCLSVLGSIGVPVDSPPPAIFPNPFPPTPETVSTSPTTYLIPV